LVVRNQIPVPLNEVERLAALRQLCLLDTPPDAVFDQLTALAARTFGVPMALVSLVDARRQWFKSRVGLDVLETPREHAFCAHAINHVDVFVVLDAQHDERFSDNPLVSGFPHIRFYAGAPLVMRDGTCPGTLCIIGTEPRTEFTDEERRVLQDLASLVTARMETLRMVGYVDPQTKLPNRTRFAEDLDGWLADKSRKPDNVAATAVDVCGTAYYGAMVKALGHSYAEGYLLSATQRLKEALPSGMTLYRISISLFGFICGSADDEDLVPLFKRIIAAFESPIEHCDIPHGAKPTLGCVRVAQNGSGADVCRSLLALADSVREQGRDWGFFEHSGDEGQKRAFRVLPRCRPRWPGSISSALSISPASSSRTDGVSA
jgi:GGDEF domain-containing protein